MQSAIIAAVWRFETKKVIGVIQNVKPGGHPENGIYFMLERSEVKTVDNNIPFPWIKLYVAANWIALSIFKLAKTIRFSSLNRSESATIAQKCFLRNVINISSKIKKNQVKNIFHANTYYQKNPGTGKIFTGYQISIIYSNP